MTFLSSLLTRKSLGSDLASLLDKGAIFTQCWSVLDPVIFEFNFW